MKNGFKNDKGILLYMHTFIESDNEMKMKFKNKQNFIDMVSPIVKSADL